VTSVMTIRVYLYLFNGCDKDTNITVFFLCFVCLFFKFSANISLLFLLANSFIIESFLRIKPFYWIYYFLFPQFLFGLRVTNERY